jgi:glutathione S-transferase
MSTSSRPLLYTARICPFAQRPRIVAALKNIKLDEVEISLRDKPASFLEVNPQGKVPALKLSPEKDVMVESLVISEYLDDVAEEGASLMGSTAEERAYTRQWIAWFGDNYIPPFYQFMRTQEPALQQEKREKLEAALEVFDAQARKYAGEGPFLTGATVGMLDVATVPFFERIAVLEHYRDWKLPARFEFLHRWLKAMDQTAYLTTKATNDFLVTGYVSYAKPAA